MEIRDAYQHLRRRKITLLYNGGVLAPRGRKLKLFMHNELIHYLVYGAVHQHDVCGGFTSKDDEAIRKVRSWN